ncbi:MAG: hypothetical protein ABIH35_03580 [Patescibacteria group bacterium]
MPESAQAKIETMLKKIEAKLPPLQTFRDDLGRTFEARKAAPAGKEGGLEKARIIFRKALVLALFTPQAAFDALCEGSLTDQEFEIIANMLIAGRFWSREEIKAVADVEFFVRNVTVPENVSFILFREKIIERLVPIKAVSKEPCAKSAGR